MISSPRRAATMPNRKRRAASKSESVIDDTGLFPTHAAACEPFVRVAGLSCPLGSLERKAYEEDTASGRGASATRHLPSA